MIEDVGWQGYEMLPANLIAKKRDGLSLSDDEIRFMINGFVAGEVADYQMSALAMAIVWRGMTPEEVASLTVAMLESGEKLPRDPDGLPRVDKHSTGGLGDKVSLVLAPLLACHDVVVPMISGRGLGLSGGTLDKLESIPGFRVQLETSEREKQLREIGLVMIGASEKIAPADRKLYALRDVTATVESVALITASILSKKLAASLDALVMDVKVGSAAFMKNQPDAVRLATSIVNTGRLSGLPTRALITDMDQPLGSAVGNAIEVNEALEILEQSGPAEVRELTLALSAELLCLVGKYDSISSARVSLERSLANGAARERFERMVSAQGGRLSGPLPLASGAVVHAKRDGYVAEIDCETIGRCIVEMGGGRRRVTDAVDPSVGVNLFVRIGDSIRKGQPLVTIRSRSQHEHWLAELANVIRIVESPVAGRALIVNRVTEEGKVI